MFGFKRNIKKEKYFIDWKDNKVKMTIYHENRKDSRVSLSKSGVNIRLPLLLPEFEKKRLIEKFVIWVKERLNEKPHFHYDKYRKYTHQEVLTLFDQDYTILLDHNTRRNPEGILKKNTLSLFVAKEEKEVYEKTVSQLVYKLLAKKYKPIIWNWLVELNEKHKFGDLKSMRMKNNSTNWGSCSSKGNINISIRLLLAPKDVVEYVLIHELAHLQQQNHSEAFWTLVAEACPNFKKHEIWLKQHAKNCVI